MNRDQGIPDRQPPGIPPQEGDRLAEIPPIHQIPVARSPVPPLPPKRTGTAAPAPPQPKLRVRRKPQPPPPAAAPIPAPVDDTPADQPLSQPPRKVLNKLSHFLIELTQNWKFWVIASLLITAGSGAFALAVLLRLPGLPNCPAVFWPLASASLRFECARLAADKQTMKDLLEAIALVDSLPADHPMREEADRLIQMWSEDVLNLAEVAFNQGKLNEAIAAARRIPAKAAASKVVEERVQRWQSIWSKAEELYRKSEAELRKLNWRGAFEYAVRLLDVENTFWQTTKYEELSKRIDTARQDGNKLFKAERLADEGGLDNLLEAIKLAESIGKQSYVYQEAQKSIIKFGRAMLDLADKALAQKDLAQALRILEKIPEKGSLKEEAKDMTVLANAQSHAWQNSVAGLEEAIAEAQRIDAKRPLRKKAQQLIARWQLEIAGVAQLEKARGLAEPGTVEDLSAAIAQASQIAYNNPRRAEAEKEIQSWTSQIQTMQDRPILDQADQIASQGTINALQAAIGQASQITSGRALYKEAQDKIASWTAEIQRFQDQPILDRAREFANVGNLSTAIEVASQIRSGALAGEAQSDIATWRQQLQAAADRATGERKLQEAQQLASTGTPDALIAAIDRVDQVPAGSGYRGNAEAVMNQWSWQLLQIAETQANSDPAAAITIAQRIPSNTQAYSQAQQRIQEWQQWLGQGAVNPIPRQ